MLQATGTSGVSRLAYANEPTGCSEPFRHSESRLDGDEDMLGKNTPVLLTGATGFTGSVLARRLCQLGCKVRAIARAGANRSALQDLPIEWTVGDIYEQSVVDSAAESVEYVFHVAAAYRDARITDDIYWKVNVESTQKLADAVSRLAPELKRFVHFSTVGVHGHVENPPADETAPFDPGDIYQETKLEAERWITGYAESHTLPLTVIRPAAIHGPSDDRLLKLFKLSKLPIVPIIGRSKGRYHLIHVEDLASFAMAAAVSQETVGEVYICGNERPTSIREIIEIVAKEMNRDCRFISIPAAPVFLAARICELICKPFGIDPPLYPRRVAFFTKDRAFDTSKMQSVPGFSLKYSNKTGLIDTCQRYFEAGLL